MTIAKKLAAGVVMLGIAIWGSGPVSASIWSATLNLGSNTGFIAESFPPNTVPFGQGAPDRFSMTVGADVWGLSDLAAPGLSNVVTGPNSELQDFSLSATNAANDVLSIQYIPDFGVDNWLVTD